MGLFAATVTALLPPLIYLLMEIQGLNEALETEARAQSSLLTRMVARNPQMWGFDSDRLITSIIDVRNLAHRSTIMDVDGRLLATLGDKPDWPIRSATVDFMESGAAVGHVTVEGSLRPALQRTLWKALLSGLLGLMLFYPLYHMHLRSIQRANAALEASEARFRELAGIGSEWIWEQDENLRFTEHGILDRPRTGFAVESIIGRTRWELPILLSDAEWAAHRADLDARRPFNRLEYRIHDQQGAVRWYSISGRPIFDEAGVFRGYRGTGREITGRKQNEQRIATLSRQLQIAADGAGIGIWRWSADEEHLYWDEQMYRQYHTTAEKFPNPYKIWALSLSPEDMQTAIEHIQVVWHGGGSRHLDFPAYLPDGTHRFFRAYAVLETDESGKGVGVIGTHWDITQEKMIEEELRQHRDHLQVLVEERTADLKHAKEEAERANRTKSEFLANMSHELRTPMHGILSFARLGQQRTDQSAPEKLRGYFTHIHDSGSRLMLLLNDLLDLSKLEAGRMTMNFGPVALEPAIKDVLHEFSEFAASRQVRLERAGGENLILHADRERLVQVLRNIISNAIKFTTAGGRVRILWQQGSLRTETGSRPAARIVVRDDGIGIPPGEEESIFDKFVQSTHTKSGAGGTGLGLAICREIVALHGGSISAGNNPEGGAAFTLLLPLETHGDKS